MLENLEPITRQYHCAVRLVMEDLDTKDRAILVGAIDDLSKWTPYSLSRALQNKGVKLGEKTIAKHRAKGCSC